MSQYAKLDELILATVKSGPWNFTELHQSGVLRAERVRLEYDTGRDGVRILAGRLQALRRAGKIRYTGGKAGQGWDLVKGDQQ